jgi:hypothetical protein
MRIPTFALPLVGTTAGLLFGGAGFAGAALWNVTGAPAHGAFTLATRV